MNRVVASLILFGTISLFEPLAASAVTIDWSPVGNPGNAPDPAAPLPGRYSGAVAYNYRIGTYDVTNSQYAEFLNSKDPTGANTLGLYDVNMALAPTVANFGGGGISFTAGNADGGKYTLISGAQNHPVNFVSWPSALRFANWLNNGQGSGDTETGAYTLLGGTSVPSNGDTLTRNADARVFLPSMNEWYKAAYYDPRTTAQGGPPSDGHYWLYPTSSNLLPIPGAPTGLANHVNSNGELGTFTDVGAYTGTTSPYGAFDMAGNVYQMTDTHANALPSIWLFVPGESHLGVVGESAATNWNTQPMVGGGRALEIGFRVASVPEPSSAVLVICSVVCLAAWGWRRRSGPVALRPVKT